MRIRERKTLNKSLLRKLALKLRRLRHEEHYGQGMYFRKTDCGTAACIAGHAAVLVGGRPHLPGGQRYGFECRIKGEVTEAHYIAQGALGLSEETASALFSGCPEITWERFSLQYAERWKAVMAGTSTERPSRIAADLLDALANGTVKP